MADKLNTGKWANIIKVRAIAAAIAGYEAEALDIQFDRPMYGNFPATDKTEWEPPDDSTIEKIILKTFEKDLPFAITKYDTKYAKALDYRWSKKFGIGGWPNCILISNNKLVLTQFRNEVDLRALVQATGLHLILDDHNCEGVNEKFAKEYQLKKPVLSSEIYFINTEGFLTKGQIYLGIQHEVIAGADKLRQQIKKL